MIRRIQLGRSEETREWKLPSDATSFVDESAQARLKYAYRIACLWAGGGTAEDHEVEVTALAEPPELPKAELRVQAGSVAIRYLPVPASARLRFTGSVVYTSARPIADLEALFAELPCFDRAQAESLDDDNLRAALRRLARRAD